ncbi:APC family permease [Terricaulis silvestris]|uniref:Putative amino acid permease YhdG n=1 Tax=Terricaulis silvestris TaxID=2686094 RepID=A0A6I6MTY2_9CAUL|nr:amino acid permease [Terricaulis silvestris]QGZ96838.1 putative amino acid permease YhdG [Terricaulis silvestris]
MANTSNTGGGKVTPPLGRLFMRKSVEQMHAEHAGGELKKSLGALNLVLLGIGCIIGTGIFVLTGRAAANFAGPGIMISFVITGFLCAFVALAYSELAAAIPVSGSAYSYSYASMGEFVAWIMGLLLLLEYGVAASTVAVGWSGYVVSLLQDFGIHIPPALTAAPGVMATDAVTGAEVAGIVNLPALIGIIGVTCLLSIGISESATVNNIVVAIKVTVVVAFIVIGSAYVKPELWDPLVPPREPALPEGMSLWAQITGALGDVISGQNNGKYGIGGLIQGAAVIFFAYIGFEAVSTAGAESKNPARDMPIGILGSLAICTVLYIATCAVLVGIVPYTELNTPAPIATAVNAIGLPWFALLVKLGAVAGLTSVMLVLLYGQTRIFYTMSRDGLLPSIFARVNKKTKTPVLNTILVGAVAAGFAGFKGLDFLGDITNVGTLVAFGLICITVIYLRFARPNLNRPFSMPGWLAITIAAMGAIMCFILFMSLMSNEHMRQFFGWYLAGGVVVYFIYGMWNSKLGRGITVTGHEPQPDLGATGQQRDDTNR